MRPLVVSLAVGSTIKEKTVIVLVDYLRVDMLSSYASFCFDSAAEADQQQEWMPVGATSPPLAVFTLTFGAAETALKSYEWRSAITSRHIASFLTRKFNLLSPIPNKQAYSTLLTAGTCLLVVRIDNPQLVAKSRLTEGEVTGRGVSVYAIRPWAQEETKVGRLRGPFYGQSLQSVTQPLSV